MSGRNEMSVQKIIDLDPMEIPLTTFFPAASLTALEGERALFDGAHVDFATGMARIAIQSHVLRVDGAIVLIDTCVGEHKDRPLRPTWNRRSGTDFLKQLDAAGHRPGDIDFVFCTHLHADHVGWNTRLDSGHWVPTFPNARYLAGKSELANWRKAAETEPEVNHGSYRDSVLPVLDAGLVDEVSPGEGFVEGTKIIPLPGHTLGQIGLEVRSGQGPDLLFCGDAIHSPVQVSHPEWSSFLCDDPALAVTTRNGLIERAARGDTLLMPAHLRAAPALGVRRLGERHQPVFCDCEGKPL